MQDQPIRELSATPAGIRFQTTYGHVQPRYWRLYGLTAVIGIVGVPVGIFWNEGWEAAGHPLEPWAATLIIEIFAVGALLTVAYVGLAAWRRRTSPQRVAVTDSALIVPKGAFSGTELVLPFTEINTTVYDVGFVKQLQIKHGRRKMLLTSAWFSSTAEFDRFISHLPSR
jgi:hypothetical protein